MEIRRCMKCMHELRAEETVCPHCGQEYGASQSEFFALKPGTILDGKFLVGEMLGQGGFGITYVGFDLLLEQKVAIKEYFPNGLVTRMGSSTVLWNSTMMQKTGMEKGFESFLKEARKMAKLGAIPGVVGVKTVFIENETAYIVMDYVEGETLLNKLQREGRMDFPTCVRLLTPIMHALAQVHQHGIIHRDISPDNIMVKKDGSLVLLDLGAAKDLEIKDSSGNTQHSSQLVAKHGFSPAEQYGHGTKIGPWTDVYAMSATIYYCCTGQVPQVSVERIMGDTLQCLPLLKPQEFAKLGQGMKLQYQERISSMTELIRLLNQGSGPIPQPPKPQPPKPGPAPVPPKPAALPKWLLPVCGAAVLIFALSRMGSSSNKPTSTPSYTEPKATTQPAQPTQPVQQIVQTTTAATVPVHEHVWLAATCTEPQRCKSCGETVGSPDGHNWEPATYDRPKTCTVCHITDGEPLKPASVYLVDLPYKNKNGKLWTWSEYSVSGTKGSDPDNANDYRDTSTIAHTTGTVMDHNGNRYTNALTIDGLDLETFYVSYDLGGKYTSFTGVCALISSIKSTTHSKSVDIYCDGEKVFSSGTLNRYSSPVKIDINVTGVSTLKIQYAKTGGESRIATIFDGKLS